MELRPDGATDEAPHGAPENDLEAALRRAATDPAARPDFYAALLDATVYVVGSTDPDAPVPTTTEQVDLRAGDRIALLTLQRPSGEPIVPFFASHEALERTLTEPASFMAMPARALLDLTRGGWLVFNPGSRYGKEFSPGEVEALLSSGTTQTAQPHVVQEDTEVLIGQPAERPEALLAALARFFQTRPAVQSARLALIVDPSRSPDPALLVGVEAETDDLDRLMHETGTVAADAAPDGKQVDLVRVSGADHFLAGIEPFYVRDLEAARASAEALARQTGASGPGASDAPEKRGFLGRLFGR